MLLESLSIKKDRMYTCMYICAEMNRYISTYVDICAYIHMYTYIGIMSSLLLASLQYGGWTS